MCLMKLPIPTSLVDRSHLTRFHHGYDALFYYRTTLSMEICHRILSLFSARPSQETIRVTAGDGCLGTGCHTYIYKHKVVSYDIIKMIFKRQKM